MRFAVISAALVASVSAGGPAYGYSSSAVDTTTCTEEASSTPAPVYYSSSTPAPVYYSSSTPAPVYYSSSSSVESTSCPEETSTPAPVYYSSTAVPVYTTKTVTAITTYCPEATTITHGSSTYTVSSATTLTITNCPCTVTEPVPVYTSTPAPAPVYTPPVYSNGTTVVTSGYAAPTGTSMSVPQYTGAASQLGAPAAGLAAVAGIAAYFL